MEWRKDVNPGAAWLGNPIIQRNLRMMPRNKEIGGDSECEKTRELTNADVREIVHNCDQAFRA
jgi:hypothetical protein